MRRISAIYLLLAIALTSLPAMTMTKPTKSQLILEREFNFILKNSNSPHTIKSIYVYSQQSRRSIYQLNPDFLLNPASNLKIVTSSVALRNLGASYKFRTSVFATAHPRGNTIEGGILVQTCGDPIVTDMDLDSIAKSIAMRGITNISGNLTIDVSNFDSTEWGPGWAWDDEPGDYQMFVSPACLDGNSIRLHVSLDSSSQNLALTTVPKTGFVRVLSTAVADTVDSLFATRTILNDSNTIIVSGRYLPHKSFSYDNEFSVRYPADYFGTVFKEMLQRHGIKVAGSIVVSHSAINHGTADTLFVLEHRIDTVITYINKVSDNLGAECLLREVPYVLQAQSGSPSAGIRLEEQFLNQCGVDSSEFQIVDGSGLSRYDLIDADAIVKILKCNLDQTFHGIFIHSLPIAGLDGTLGKRMKESCALGHISAKTGSLDGVSTLSGYVFLPTDTLVFSMMFQNFIVDNDSMRAVQDSLCIILSLYNARSSKFIRNLRRENVGTYWAAYQKREAYRERVRELRKKRKLLTKTHTNPLVKR